MKTTVTVDDRERVLPRPAAGNRRAAAYVRLFAGGVLDDENEASTTGWLLFDADCSICSGFARKARTALGARGVQVIPLQTPWVEEFLAARREPLLKEIRFLEPGGRLRGGADALLAAADRVWWSRPAAWLGRLPAMRPAMAWLYAHVAGRRHCVARFPRGAHKAGA